MWTAEKPTPEKGEDDHADDEAGAAKRLPAGAGFELPVGTGAEADVASPVLDTLLTLPGRPRERLVLLLLLLLLDPEDAAVPLATEPGADPEERSPSGEDEDEEVAPDAAPAPEATAPPPPNTGPADEGVAGSHPGVRETRDVDAASFCPGETGLVEEDDDGEDEKEIPEIPSPPEELPEALPEPPAGENNEEDDAPPDATRPPNGLDAEPATLPGREEEEGAAEEGGATSAPPEEIAAVVVPGPDSACEALPEGPPDAAEEVGARRNEGEEEPKMDPAPKIPPPLFTGAPNKVLLPESAGPAGPLPEDPSLARPRDAGEAAGVVPADARGTVLPL